MKTVSDRIALYFQNIAATLGGIPCDGGGDARQKIGKRDQLGRGTALALNDRILK